jgi:hypothetical protein
MSGIPSPSWGMMSSSLPEGDLWVLEKDRNGQWTMLAHFRKSDWVTHYCRQRRPPVDLANIREDDANGSVKSLKNFTTRDWIALWRRTRFA